MMPVVHCGAQVANMWRDPNQVAEFEQDNTFTESAAWVLDLAALLLSRETASGAVDALVATMKVSISPRLARFSPILVYAPRRGLVSLMINS